MTVARRIDSAVRRGPEFLWRGVFNLPAQVHYWRNKPVLERDSASALNALRRDGVAVSSLEALTGETKLFESLFGYAREAERRHSATSDATDEKELALRPFLTQMFDPHRPELDPTGIVAQVALAPGLKNIVDRYFGLTTRLSDANIWRNSPISSATTTQLWHRDIAEDRRIVKVFVYLEPVVEGGGPFTYAKGSHLTAGRRDVREGMAYDGTNYRVVDDRRTRDLELSSLACFGPAGTVVIADVRGFHRGGLVTANSRFLLQLRYTSATALKQRMLSAPPGVDVSAVRRHTSYDRRTVQPGPARGSDSVLAR